MLKILESRVHLRTVLWHVSLPKPNYTNRVIIVSPVRQSNITGVIRRKSTEFTIPKEAKAFASGMVFQEIERLANNVEYSLVSQPSVIKHVDLVNSLSMKREGGKRKNSGDVEQPRARRYKREDQETTDDDQTLAMNGSQLATNGNQESTLTS
jgi:hypothetical protein